MPIKIPSLTGAFPKRKHILALSMVLMVVAIFGVGHAKNAYANAPGDSCTNTYRVNSNFLAQFDPCAFSSGGNGDRPKMDWPNSSISVGGDGSASNPFQIKVGDTINLDMGYTSQEPSDPGQHVYSWTNIDYNSNTALFSNKSIGNSTGGPSAYISNRCIDMVFTTTSPYYNYNFVGGSGGKVSCSGHFPCDSGDNQAGCGNYDSTQGHPKPDPSPGSLISSGNGDFAVWYEDSFGGNGGVQHPLNLTVAIPNEEFCLRNHVALSSAGWNPDVGYLSTVVRNVRGMAGQYDGNNSSLCFTGVSSSNQCTGCNCPDSNCPGGGGETPWAVPHCSSLVVDNNTYDPGGGSITPGGDYVATTVTVDGVSGGDTGGPYITARTGNGFSASYNTGSNSGQAQTWTFNPVKPSITVTIYKKYLVPATRRTPAHTDPIPGWNPTRVTLNNCYTARCDITGVTGDLPNGVKAGDNFTIHANITNTNTAPGAPLLYVSLYGVGLSLTANGSPNYVSNMAPGLVAIYPGQTISVSYQVNAPDRGSPYTYSTTPYVDYFGSFAVPGGGCPTASINVYNHFTLNGSANVSLQDASGAENDENPTKVVNTTYVTEGGAAVKQHVTSELYYTTSGCGRTTAGSPRFSTANDGPFNPGSTTYLYDGGPTLPNTYPPCTTPLVAGDVYCAEIDVPYTAGWVGPGGDIATTDNTPGTPVTSCPKVVNEPFMKVFNSSASAGDGFATGGVCSGGELASWNNDSGTNPSSEDYGSGTQLNALAALGITGFASNQSAPPGLNGPPTNLSFSNTSNTTGGGQNSPNLGGNFGSTSCIQPPHAQTASSALPGPVVDVGSLASGSYTYTGNLTLIGNYIALRTNVSIFVNGNVYINPRSNGITYAGSGSWSPGTVPSFNLAAQGGNIYVDPGVGELDGTYTAEPDGGGNQGKIYTCSDTTNHFTFMAKDSLYDNCNKQLVVNGSFQANQVNLMRTFGSLRDDAPVAATTIMVPHTTYGPQIGFTWNSSGGSDGNAGITAGMRCSQIFDGGENKDHPEHTWNDNFLCLPPSSPESLCWDENDGALHDGGANGCVGCNYLEIDTGANPYYPQLPQTWQDDVLCTHPQFTDGVGFSYGGPPAGTPDCTAAAPENCVLNWHPDNIGGGWYANQYRTDTRFCTLLYEDSDLDTGRDGYIWEHTYLCEPLVKNTTLTPQLVDPHQPYPRVTPCSNSGAGGLLTNQTCAAEVFDFSPELYLANPTTESSSHGALTYQAVTSLPPVL